MAILIPFELKYTQNVYLKKKKKTTPVVVKCAEKKMLNCLDSFHTSSSAMGICTGSQMAGSYRNQLRKPNQPQSPQAPNLAGIVLMSFPFLFLSSLLSIMICKCLVEINLSNGPHTFHKSIKSSYGSPIK